MSATRDWYRTAAPMTPAQARVFDEVFCRAYDPAPGADRGMVWYSAMIEARRAAQYGDDEKQTTEKKAA